MITFFSYFLDYWFLVLWVVAVLVAYRLGGRPAALAAATLGAGLVAYKMGRKTERDTLEKISKEIQVKREKAYEEIDARPTTPADVAQRLRDGGF